MTNDIIFDSKTETFHYPDGQIETLEEYNERRYRYDYLTRLQDALEKMKVLYSNPGCMNEADYEAAKRVIQDEFDFWEANVFVEYDDK